MASVWLYDLMNEFVNSEEIYQLFIKANDLEEQGNYPDAFALFSKMVNLGDFASLNNLAIMYELGRGVKKDTQKAIELYKEGWDKTQQTNFALNLAHLYNNQHNFEQAKIWWEIAIKHGAVEGKLELAKHLLTTSKPDIKLIKQLLTDVCTAIITIDVSETDWEEAQELLEKLS